MNYEEFLEPREQKNNFGQQPTSNIKTPVADSSAGKLSAEETAADELVDESAADEVTPEELDVQKQVVESLAADKAALDDEVSAKGQQIEDLKGDLAKAQEEVQKAQSVAEQAKIDVSRLQGEIIRLTNELAKAKDAVAAEQAKTSRVQDELAAEKEKQFDQQERNPNALALLDRDVEIPDRFPGETRDQVLEALAEARARAEADGRLRKAQVLEGVLLANEPNGTLAKKREELKQLFAANGNVINGTVIEELKKLGLSHKNGEEYLLVDEILKRAY